jgi:hypothetical protein
MPNNEACSPFRGDANLGYHMGFIIAFFNQYIYGENAAADRLKLLFHITGESASPRLAYASGSPRDEGARGG